MTEQDQPVTPAQPAATPQAPTCYRHPQRPTWVSCGRCGQPLCPDCVRHGPVGVRCADCLRPAAPRDVVLEAPERVGLAIGVGCGLALLWAGVLAWVALTQTQPFPAFLMAKMLRFGVNPAPNVLLSGIAGGMVGWVIWRVCGGSYNRYTIRWAVTLGLAAPLVAAGIVSVVIGLRDRSWLPLEWVFDVRVCVAVGVGALFAWLLTTRRRWDRDLFH